MESSPAVVTDFPHRVRVVPHAWVPMPDGARLAAKLWIPEYGSSEDPKQFEWLYAYSPYHHVTKGTVYPAVLFMTADSPPRKAMSAASSLNNPS